MFLHAPAELRSPIEEGICAGENLMTSHAYILLRWWLGQIWEGRLLLIWVSLPQAPPSPLVQAWKGQPAQRAPQTQNLFSQTTEIVMKFQVLTINRPGAQDALELSGVCNVSTANKI